MSDFERINAPRVEKLRKMLATIGTSATSNKASDEIPTLLEPFIADLRKYHYTIRDERIPFAQTASPPIPTFYAHQVSVANTIDPRRFPRLVHDLDSPSFRALAAAVSMRAIDELSGCT